MVVINDGYSLIAECCVADTIPVRKYRSTRTGLTIIVAETPGPIVDGSFFVATEAHDDDGLPHTLEHLIFLGSKNYPFKGSLDIIANRCLASGTNAWTDIDHTAYTVSTAGSEGFLNLLPIYLDHIFFPTLTDAGFITEVYHVTGEAKDAGVVFSEMQGIESSDSYIVSMETMRALYKRNCGYRYDTGGACANLRYSTNNEKVRKFHKQFYCPLNSTIVVIGTIDDGKLLESCYKFEDKLLEENINDYNKAWQTPVLPLEKSIYRAVTYPSDKEDTGMVMVSWQGPSLVDEFYEFLAIQVLFAYLTETAASPLMKYFVETSDPYCSEVSSEFEENSIPCICFKFSNVVIDKITIIRDELIQLLNLIKENNDSIYNLDMIRLKSVIKNYALKELMQFENDPQKTLAMILIRDTLYGKSVEELTQKLNKHELIQKMTEEPAAFWQCLLDKRLLQKPSATILGYPWENEQVVSAEIENARLNQRKCALGEEGLKKKDINLQEAIKQNSILPPDELIATVPVLKVENLKYHSIDRYTSDSENQHPLFDISSTPVYTELDDLDSKFVYFYVVVNTEKLPSMSALYLPLLLEYIKDCPITRDGKLVSQDVVAAEIEKDLLSICTSIGLFSQEVFSTGKYFANVQIVISTTYENFCKGIDWIRWLLYNSVFTYDRLVVVASKLIKSVSQYRRQGYSLVKCLAKLMNYNSENCRLTTALCQEEFLTELTDKFKTEEGRNSVIKDIENVRNILSDPSNIILHVSTNIKSLIASCPEASKYILKVLPENVEGIPKKFNIRHDYEFLSSAVTNNSGDIKSCVVGLATEDSYFMYHSTKSINDVNHPDLPALLVYLQYLVQLEGPLWRNIRGLGLAYSYNIDIKPDQGTLFLSLYRSINVVQAFAKTKEIVLEHCENTDSWNRLLFESGKSALIFLVVNAAKNVSDVSVESLFNYFMGRPDDYKQKFIQKIQDVQMEEMKKIADTYIRPLFEPTKSLSAIICNSSKCQEVKDGFKALGHELELFQTLEDSYFKPDFIKSQIANV